MTKDIYYWKPIEDYERAPESLMRPELVSLADVWQEQKGRLTSTESLDRFNERLRREWAIETGLLERIYSLDRGITEVLIERGIDASLIPHGATDKDPEVVVAIIRDHEAAIDFLFDVISGRRSLTTSYINELHALLTRNQGTTAAYDTQGNLMHVRLIRGKYKEFPNNPLRPNGSVHEYCPPEQVSPEMERLLELHHAHKGNSPEVEAAWLHHRFTQIHPFQDGNGRVARCLATLVFLRAGWFPLVIRDLKQERERYIDALERADEGDLAPLVGVFASSQKKAFVQALGISDQVLRLTRAEQVVSAITETLEAKDRKKRQEWGNARDTAGKLREVAKRRADEIAGQLSREIGHLAEGAQFFADSEPDGGVRWHYFRWQIVQTAISMDYYANVREYHSWVRLVLNAGSQSEILISFHATGPEFRGVLAASACFYSREQTDERHREVVGVTPLATEIFQINYLEPASNVTERFEEWMEEVLITGLELWRGTL